MWGPYRHLRNASPAVGEIRKDGEQTQECLVDQGHIATPPQPHTASTGQLCPANGFSYFSPPEGRGGCDERRWCPRRDPLAASITFSPSLGDEEELQVMGRGNSSRTRDLSL